MFYFSDVWNTDVTDKTDRNGFFNKAIIKNITKHIVPDSTEGSRLQAYAKEIFNAYIPSTQGIKKAIKRGQILVNDKPSNTGYRVCPGDEITLVRGEMNPPKQFELNLEIVFEDEDLAVIVKPAGIPTSGNQFKTIQNALLFNLIKSTAPDALNWSQPLHRLDAPTSGLLLVAKTKSAQINLGKQFENKIIQKQYHAIVIGQPEASGEWTTPIEDKAAHTSFQTLKTVPSLRNQYLSLVKLTPHTGRTHQLRIHLSQAGFPIMGDRLYGTPGEIFRGKGLFLAATDLKFQHPADDQQVSLSIPVPHKFESLLTREQRRYNKWRKN